MVLILYIRCPQLRELPEFQFEDIAAPVLLLHGRNDGDVSLTHSESIEKRIPQCTYCALDDTDHLVWLSPHYMQAKEAFVRFLADNPSVEDPNAQVPANGKTPARNEPDQFISEVERIGTPVLEAEADFDL